MSSRLLRESSEGGCLSWESREEHCERYKVYLDQVGVAKVPEDYEDRLTEMFPGVYKNLRICALDPYDLALSKLERNIQRDRDDVKHLARTIPLNVEKLKEKPRFEINKSCYL